MATWPLVNSSPDHEADGLDGLCVTPSLARSAMNFSASTAFGLPARLIVFWSSP
jgi:hypothetical protein